MHLTSDSLHDLASPINQIGSLSDLILKKYGATLDHEAETLFGFLQSSADRLRNLMTGVRTYMQVAGPLPSCSLCNGDTLLAEALKMIQHTIAQNEAVVTHDPLPELRCDRSQITYVLSGIIENAIKFRSESRPEVHVGSEAHRSFWILSVKDNGMGIDPRFGDRIFRTFKRIHNDMYPGSGIGLTIAKRVMERHGGRIWVESELGHGATFFLALRKSKDGSAGARPAS